MTCNFAPTGIEPAGSTPSLQLSPSRGERAFGESAARLCGAAAVLLGWRPVEFWESTPAELASVLGQISPAADGPDPGTVERLRTLFPDD